MSVLVPNNPRVRRAPRLAFLPSPRRSLRAVMALRGQITTPGPRAVSAGAIFLVSQQKKNEVPL